MKKNQSQKLTEDYYPAKTFTGAHEGYVFKTGPLGLGYYKDFLGMKKTIDDPLKGSISTNSEFFEARESRSNPQKRFNQQVETGYKFLKSEKIREQKEKHQNIQAQYAGPEEEDYEDKKTENNDSNNNTSDITQEEEEEPQNVEAMDPKQRRLFELRLKFNKARNNNQKEVIEEDKRNQMGSLYTIMQNKNEKKQQEAERRQQLIEQGLDPEKEKVMTVPATDTLLQDKKKKNAEKTQKGFGWDKYNQSSAHTLWKKKFQGAHINKDLYQKQKESLGDSFYPDADSLEYGQAPVASDPQGLERAAQEIKKKEEKLKKIKPARGDTFSVSGVNDANSRFNSQLQKAYGAYTAEIRENLERGTAL